MAAATPVKRVVVGDSWTCRESNTGLDRGWQSLVAQPGNQHGRSGSTARQWATDQDAILSCALSSVERGDTVIISLVGNDIRRAGDDGKITVSEIAKASLYLHAVARAFSINGARLSFLLYTDPFNNQDDKARAGVALMNTLIRGVAFMFGASIIDTGKILTRPEHFDGIDFHPTSEGHKAIALHIQNME